MVRWRAPSTPRFGCVRFITSDSQVSWDQVFVKTNQVQKSGGDCLGVPETKAVSCCEMTLSFAKGPI